VYSKPPRQQFFTLRAATGFCWDVYTIEDETSMNDIRVLIPAVASLLGGLVRRQKVYVGITRFQKVFLLLVRQPDDQGRIDSWGQTMLEGVALALSGKWIRITANMQIRDYEVTQIKSEVAAKLPEPQWPDLSMQEIMKVGFKDRIIRDENHPFVQRLLGEA
jgi:hypothetical protein